MIEDNYGPVIDGIVYPPFKPFPKIARFSRTVVITEKLDGTNASIYIGETDPERQQFFAVASRNRWITPEDDNMGFARWAYANKEELLKLGPGHHFGEWWGQGIQRNYGLREKRFSLFNVHRWKDDAVRPACCHVVPTLETYELGVNVVENVMQMLQQHGSYASPGYPNPEGIIIYHTGNGSLFKKTFEKDAEGKGT